MISTGREANMKILATLGMLFILYRLMHTIITWPYSSRVQKALWLATIAVSG